MAYRFRLIVLLFLSFFSFNSFSYVLNIDPGAPLYPNIYQNCKGSNYNYGNLESSLLGPGKFWVTFKSGMNNAGNCMEAFGLSCPIGTDSVILDSRYNRAVCTTKNICPANSTKINGYCVCNSGYEENGNSCVLPEPPDLCESLAEKCETLNGSKKWITGLRRDVSYKPFKTCTPAGLVPGCNKGCVINSSGNGVFYKDQSGDYYFEGEGVISSETCFPTSEGNGEPPKEEDNPLPPSEPPEKPCNPGEYQYTVNGTKVCLPAKSSETIVKEETINNNDNSTTNINTTVKCENGKCTITETTTNKDSSGATTGESNKETQVSQSDFCAQNPGSSVCKSPGLGGEEGEGEDDKKSSFSGSCSSSFSCEGDSVQCAIALEQHKTACKLFDESSTYFQAFKDAEASNSNGVESSTVDLASHLSTDSVIGSGACPADIEITVFNQPIPVELSKFCQYFDAMGMLIMLGACIGCLRILGSG